MNRLKELRKEKKLTQQKLADEIGVSKRTYIYWENGESQIKPDKAQTLADFFGVSVGYLLGYTDIAKKYEDEKVVSYPEIPDYFFPISWKRRDDEIFNKFVDFVKASDFLLTDEQIKSIFHLMEAMSDSFNAYSKPIGDEKMDDFIEKVISSGDFSLIFPDDTTN